MTHQAVDIRRFNKRLVKSAYGGQEYYGVDCEIKNDISDYDIAPEKMALLQGNKACEFEKRGIDKYPPSSKKGIQVARWMHLLL